MFSDYQNQIERHREVINSTSTSLRKEAPQAWGKLLRDEVSHSSNFHPANIRRENKYCQDIHNDIYMRATAEKRDPTTSEYEAMQCIEHIISLNNKIIEQKLDIEHNFVDIDGTFPTSKKTIFSKADKLALPFRPNNYDGIHLGHIMRGMAVGSGGNATIQNALSEGTDSAGGYTAPVEIMREFIDKLRAKSVLFNAGAKTALLEAKKSNIATVTTDPVGGWRAENAPVSESDLALGNVAFTPKSLAVLVKVSRELLQDSVNIEEMLLNSLAQGLATQLDFAGLYGSGASNQPLGLDSLLTTASQVTTVATNGAKLSASGYYREIVKAMAQVAANNDEASAIILSPRTKYDLGWMADSTNQPLQAPAIIADKAQLLDTSSIPNNLVVGTSGALCSELFVGNFENLMLGLRQELRIEIVNQTFAGNLQIGYIAHLRADWQPSRIGSFWKVRGILAE